MIEPADDPDRDLMKVEALKVCDPAAPLIICGAQGEENNTVEMLSGPDDRVAASIWPYLGGNRSGQHAACEVDRSSLIQEYTNPTYGAHFTPDCSEITYELNLDTKMPNHFTFGMLNISEIEHSPYPHLAILADALLKGVEDILSRLGYSTFAISAGYRSPMVNQLVEINEHDCCHPDSQHVHGNAIDIPAHSSFSEWTRVRDAALRANACTEPPGTREHPSYSHVHAQWLNPQYPNCPAGWGHP